MKKKSFSWIVAKSHVCQYFWSSTSANRSEQVSATDESQARALASPRASHSHIRKALLPRSTWSPSCNLKLRHGHACSIRYHRCICCIYSYTVKIPCSVYQYIYIKHYVRAYSGTDTAIGAWSSAPLCFSSVHDVKGRDYDDKYDVICCELILASCRKRLEC